MKNILIIAAHPDDEMLGCGGTIVKKIKEGFTAYSLILGEGITGRDNKREPERRKSELRNLKDQSLKANKALGIHSVQFMDLPDNRFDSIPLLDIVKSIEKSIRRIKPEIIYTHFRNDLNIDHQIAYKCVITATRPSITNYIKEIYSFEISSSTENNFPLSFSPNTFSDISKYLPKKIKALSYYKNEMKPYPHPRSLKSVTLTAKGWGIKYGLNYAEAFEVVRLIG